MSEAQGTGGLWNLSALIGATGDPSEPQSSGDPSEPQSSGEPPAGDTVRYERTPELPVTEEPRNDDRVAPDPAKAQPLGAGPVPPAPAPALPVSAPVRRGRIRLTAPTIVGLAVAATFVVAASGGAVAVMNRTVPPAVAPPPVMATTDTTPLAGADVQAPSPVTSPMPNPSPTVDNRVAALQTLQELRDTDLGTVALDGQYVAQLASKNAGIVDPYQTAADGTHTFQATDILAEHMRLRRTDSLGTRIVLLLSTDYGRRQLYHGQPLWVTLALGDFGSAAAVQQWCIRRFPGLTGAVLEDHCTPRRLEPVRG